MTDQELIKALRCCYEDGNCTQCPFIPGSDDCQNAITPTLFERMEALLAENELYYREIARLKAECDHFRDLTKKMWCEKQYCKGTGANASKVESFRCTGEKCPFELGDIRRCTMRGCPWRTTPRTEVE